MRLNIITATAHPSGNRIDLAWENSDPAQFPGVRVVRRAGSYPTSPPDGVLVAQAVGLSAATDTGLKGETVYYYSLFPFHSNPQVFDIDPHDRRHNRVAALATSPYDSAGQLYDLLPAIYRRYDTILPREPFPPGMAPADTLRGQLRRFLDLPGGQLDQLRSLAQAALDLYDRDQVDGRLLPLLAQWIGWQTDYSTEIAAQRNEIRNAPAVYQTIGLIPTVEATVKRISGWESRTKEFVHNVFLSNHPERLNLWARERNADGDWLDLPKEPLSVNFAYEGRPSAVRDADNTLWLFYHTLKKGSWDIWYKTYRDDHEEQWSPSQPLTSDPTIDKYPSAVFHDGRLCVFWAAYHEGARAWSVKARTRTADGTWSNADPFANDGIERCQPFAVVDNADRMWLFWLEREGQRWRLKYTRYAGGAWETPVTFPDDAGRDPRVESDLFVLFHPARGPMQRFWVFWARQAPTGDPNQTRWTIVFRTKRNTKLNDSGWSPITTLSTMPPTDDDREPAAFVGAGGNFELFWSSNRAGGWSIWRSTLNTRSNTWSIAEQLTSGPYSQRDPLPFATAEGTVLVYRSNQSLRYASGVYGATETVDFRYAGSTTVDSGNAGKIALWGAFEDFQAYSYDVGKGGSTTEGDWYARDTIGLYLTPDKGNADEIRPMKDRIRRVLGEFMPMTVRAVLITTE